MIPIEMTHYPAWVVWRLESRGTDKPTKVPYNPRTLMRASTTEPSHWATYQEAISLYQSGHGNFSGVGFVLSERDPYCIIDLDDPTGDDAAIARALKVIEAFDSYTEISQSGNGLHIILRGHVASGKRKGKIEVYSQERFFALTGNTYRDTTINQCDYWLQNLWNELAGATLNAPEIDLSQVNCMQKMSDAEVYEKCKQSYASFVDLFFGRFQAYYGSQSEADLALVNMIGFFSRNADQIARMFFASALGKRPKARRKDYLTRMIRKSFDNMLPNIDFSAMMANLHVEMQKDREALLEKAHSTMGEEIELPSGLLGEIAQFIYSSSPHPVKEVALAGAIGLMAGICGRSYNVSGTGLNQYVLLLASTGRGKEAARAGISKIMREVEAVIPGASKFIGPGTIASGQALFKQLNEEPCFVSILGEFGITIQNMCDKYASPAMREMQKVILDLFSKSGFKDTLSPMVYSKRENNTAMVYSPALSILAETTPDNFYPHLTEAMISSGLLPRFTCIEYNGPRAHTNKAHINVKPSPEMIEKIVKLCEASLAIQNASKGALRGVVNIQYTPEASDFLDKYDRNCTDKINSSGTEAICQAWTRAHMKLLKLASLIAVGNHPYQPVITIEDAKWSELIITRDIAHLTSRFERGGIGPDHSELSQIEDMKSIIKDYVCRPCDETLQRYSVSPEMHRDRVIQHSYFSRRALQKGSFRTDRMGATFAMKRALDLMIAEGTLTEINAIQMKERYNTTGKAYFVLSVKQLD